MTTLRLFVALEIPPRLLDALADRCRELRPAFPKARWVRPAAMHLTLSFLGATDRDDLPNLDRELAAAFAAAPPLDLRLAGVGAFPPRGKARVLWAGVADAHTGAEPETLLALQEEVAAGVGRALDLEPEGRPFHPHVTLARLNPPWARSQADAFAQSFNATQPFGEVPGETFTVDHGTLFESELHPSGARYRVVETWPLEAA